MDWLNSLNELTRSVLSYYDNIEYDNFRIASFSSFGIAIIGLYLGMVIACVVSLYSKRYLAGFVNHLLDLGANSPEKAITVREAGYSRYALLYRSLKDGKVVRKTVYAVKEDAEGASGRTNTGSARFYIPEEKAEGARIRYYMKNTNLVVAVVSIVVLSVISALVYIFLPDVFRIIDNTITLFKNM